MNKGANFKGQQLELTGYEAALHHGFDHDNTVQEYLERRRTKSLKWKEEEWYQSSYHHPFGG
ncbi:MAG: hypothetical protein WHW07_09910 [Bacteroidales bacterium]